MLKVLVNPANGERWFILAPRQIRRAMPCRQALLQYPKNQVHTVLNLSLNYTC